MTLVLRARLAGLMALALAGCGDDDRRGVNDAGTDAAPPAVDAGAPATDAGRGDSGAPRANGTNGAWRTLDPMPEPRANFCSAVVGNRVVVIGGNYRPAGAPDFVTTANVHVATTQADGTLGAWTLAGTYPTPVRECTALGIGEALWVLDGIVEDDPTYERVVMRATLDTSGMLGAWSMAGRVPAEHRLISKEAFVVDGALVALTSTLAPAVEQSIVLRASIETSGMLGAWTEQAWVPGFRGQAQYAARGDVVWMLGGYLGATEMNRTVPNVDAVRITTSGSVMPIGTPSVDLPAPRTFGEAVTVDDWIVVVGGKPAIFGAPGAPDVYLGHIGLTTAVDMWEPGEPMPAGRTNHEAVVVGQWLYVLGGGLDAGGLDSVFVSQVRF